MNVQSGHAQAEATQRGKRWLAVTLIFSLTPAGALLPAWCWGSVLALVALRFAAWHGARQGLPRRIRWVLSSIVLLAWGWGFRGHWLGGPSVIAFFAFVLVLKWHEMTPRRWRRDVLILAVGACVLGALGAVHHVALWGMLTLPLLTFSMLATLAALHGVEHPTRQALSVLAWALPLSALLFLGTPRVQGPLWDFGMALGLPIGVSAPKSSAGLGSQATLTPGGTNAGGLEDGTVLVARFEGYRPPAAKLYWRGPVFATFDGTSWTPSPWWSSRSSRMAQGYRRANIWRAQFEGRGEPLRYHVRVAGHGGDWLYGLDLPAALPAESYITKDRQLLSMTPIAHESSYHAASWLEWRETSPHLDDADRRETLAWPSNGSNPRLLALGRNLATHGTNPADIVASGLSQFTEGRFKLNPKVSAQAGPLSYDTFMFEQRTGGPDQFAGAFVLLMRAAGVPARLITGYRGGRPMGATDYLLVKQSNAHAWAEVWLDKRGWVRADPADIVAPMRERKAAAKAEASDQPRPSPQANNTAQPEEKQDSGWQWINALDGWVLHYDADRRAQLLEGLSEMRTDSLWLVMLILCAASPLLAGWYWWQRSHSSAHNSHTAWQLLRQRLADVGFVVGPAECPTQVADRLASQPAAWAESAAVLARQLAQLLYADNNDQEAKQRLQPLLKQIHCFRPAAFRDPA